MIGANIIDAGERTAAVRAFNRFWTRQIGVLDAGLLQTPYSLTEARVIFELAQAQEVDLAELRRELAIDAGYLSRIIKRLKAEGLAAAEASSGDGRRQVVRLTPAGRATFETLDARSAAEVSQLLGRFDDEDQRQLLSAMKTIRELFAPTASPRAYVIRRPRPGDLGWVVYRHGWLYHQEFGWDERFEALVARIVADYAEDHDDQREAAWIAEMDGERVGCVFCVRADDVTAKLRLLLVEPKARGLGVGARLVGECIDFAQRSGYRRMTLWTNDVLESARRIYEAVGFRSVEEKPHRMFGPELVGQTWDLDLQSSSQR